MCSVKRRVVGVVVRRMGQAWVTTKYAAWRLFYVARAGAADLSIPTHMTVPERLALFRFVRRLPAGARVVEVGSYLGASACVLAQGLSRLPGSELHCVDTWQNDAMSEGPRDTFSTFQANTRRHGQLIRVHRGRSNELAGAFEGLIDFLFLDGDHSYEGCLDDTLSWLPKLRDGGIVAYHDVAWSEGVQRVVATRVVPFGVVLERLPNLVVLRFSSSSTRRAERSVTSE